MITHFFYKQLNKLDENTIIVLEEGVRFMRHKLVIVLVGALIAAVLANIVIALIENKELICG